MPGTVDRRGRVSLAVRALILVLALVIGLPIGCGSERPPPAGFGRDLGGTTVGSDNVFNTDGGSTKPPGCGTKPDGSQCDCIDVPLFVDAPTMYFVLDRSGSMDANNKWTQVRLVVAKIMRTLGPRANFGAAMYPAQTQDSCAPGTEILKVSPGDPPSSSADGPTTTALLTATRVQPNGGTPTGATLQALLPRLNGLPGQVFVILATDGAPNCNLGISCSYETCQTNILGAPGCPPAGPTNCCESDPGNCTDATGTLSAISSLASVGIKTYVVGLPGAETFANLLDDMAVAGQTPLPTSPKYFAVTSASENTMFDALKKVAAKITATCVFDLKEAPSDPALVNVYLDDVALPYEPTNGWLIDGKRVTLVGSACQKVQNGDILGVRIIAGCPRVEPR